MSNFYQKLCDAIGAASVREQEPMSAHTTFRAGGPARYFVTPEGEKELAAVLAGPAVNLLCGLLLARGHAWVAAGAHLSLCLFNLLPVRPLDGGRALALAVSALAGPAAGEGAARWAGALTALTLGALSLWLMGRTGGSLWLLPAAAGLLAAGARELTGKKADFL